MPHDAKGQLIRVGDVVLIRTRVTHVAPGENCETCSLELDQLDFGDAPTIQVGEVYHPHMMNMSSCLTLKE
jgi:hypothetical protein